MKHLTTLLLTLLVLGGCSQEPTELEICIEANQESLIFKDKLEKYLQSSKDIKKQEEFWKIYLAFSSKFNSSEEEMYSCISELTQEEMLKAEPTYLEWNHEKTIKYWITNEYINIKLSKFETCSQKTFKEDKEKAKKFCNSQGIYETASDLEVLGFSIATLIGLLLLWLVPLVLTVIVVFFVWRFLKKKVKD